MSVRQERVLRETPVRVIELPIQIESEFLLYLGLIWPECGLIHKRQRLCLGEWLQFHLAETTKGEKLLYRA